MVSRSGTLTHQIGNVLAQSGFGNSTIVGIGGDPVPGTVFIDVTGMFQEDPETELIVMCGEIGGDAEELGAEFITADAQSPRSRTSPASPRPALQSWPRTRLRRLSDARKS